MLGLAAVTPSLARDISAGIVPVQLLLGPNPPPAAETEKETGKPTGKDATEPGKSRSEDMKDGVLSPPPTGDTDAVKMPPEHDIPPYPRAAPRQ